LEGVGRSGGLPVADPAHGLAVRGHAALAVFEVLPLTQSTRAFPRACTSSRTSWRRGVAGPAGRHDRQRSYGSDLSGTSRRNRRVLGADALQLGEVVLHSHPDADRPDAAVGPHPHAAAGIPTLHYGPGDARLAHGPDERVPVHEVLTSARTLAALALDHCGVA
jgi:hypothetical protein